MSAGQRLRIGMVVPGFSANEADWCIPALLDLVRRLATAHDVTVYTLRYPHFRRRYSVYGARVHAFGGATNGGLRRLPLLWRAIRAIVADARRKPFSILHGLWADEAGFVAAVAARRAKTPALVSLMGGELARFPELRYGVQLSQSGRLLTRFSLRSATAVAAGSRQLLEQATTHVPQRRLHLLPLGVDLSRFGPSAMAAGDAARRIVHAASLTPVKEQQVLLEAFARANAELAPQEVSLHIAGDGPLRSALEAQVLALGIARRVQFCGALPHERLPDFYRQGSLFVLSSRHESQSMVSLEAAACGVPLAGTAVGLLPQLLPSKYLAAPGDARALAGAIVCLLRDEETRLKEVHRLQSLVGNHYGLHKTVGDLVEVYAHLIAAHDVGNGSGAVAHAASGETEHHRR